MNTVTELEKVLAQEIDLYRKYSKTLNDDIQWMTKLNVEELEKNNKAKNTLLLKIKALDQARLNLIKKFAIQHGIAEDKIRLTDICEKVTPAEGKRLKVLKDELHAIVTELQQAQIGTAHLAQASLNWVNSSIATLHRLLSPTGTYNPQGKVDRETHFTGRVVEKQV